MGSLEARSRQVVEQMAKVAAGSVLLQHAPSAVSDAYCATRLGRDWGDMYGTLPHGSGCRRDHGTGAGGVISSVTSVHSEAIWGGRNKRPQDCFVSFAL